MNVFADIQAQNITQLDPALLVNALKALQELTWSAQSDIFSDAPECVEGVCRVETAIQAAYEVLIQIREVLDVSSTEEPTEGVASYILDETEEVVKLKRTAVNKANRAELPEPLLIEDYQSWIDEITKTQDLLTCIEDVLIEVTIDSRSSKERIPKLQGLGALPSPSSWDYLDKERGIDV